MKFYNRLSEIAVLDNMKELSHNDSQIGTYWEKGIKMRSTSSPSMKLKKGFCLRMSNSKRKSSTSTF